MWILDFLTVKEVAELKGCTPRYIKKIAKDGKLEAKQELNPQNNCLQYLIPLSTLPRNFHSKYFRSEQRRVGK